MIWDDLINAGAPRWKCGHPRTPENTQSGHRQSKRCKICHREAARDYKLRLRAGAARGAQNLRDGTIDQEQLKADRVRAADLGGEFLRGINRWVNMNRWRGV